MTLELHSDPPKASIAGADLAATAELSVTQSPALDCADPHKLDTATDGLADGRRLQVKKCILTLTRDGYMFQSADYPSKSLLFCFDGSVSSLVRAKVPAQLGETAELENDQSVAVHAIVGTIELELSRYVLVVTSSRCRGTIAGSQIYEVSAIAALPLDAKYAKASFLSLQRGMQEAGPEKCEDALQSSDEGGDGGSSDGSASSNADSRVAAGPPTALESTVDTNSNTAKPSAAASLGWISPQFTRLFGRSRAGSTSPVSSAPSSTPKPSTLGRSKLVDESRLQPPSEASQACVSMERSVEATLAKHGSSVRRMEDRVIEELGRLFGSTGMFFSYDYDLTRSFQGKEDQAFAPGDALLALVADEDYWFNHNLQRLLLASDAEEWAMPLIQGSVQVAICNIPGGASFQVCVLSRRNRRRVGVRYERRGANGQGHVANFVETEQILTVEASGQPKHYASFLQTRGSIPFFWKQPPTGLHPTPVVVKSDEENAAVCAAHLQREIKRCGRQVLISLVEHKGREAVLGATYASLVGQCVADELVDACMVRYIPWDFHHETRGMHYERLGLLLDQLEREVSDMGYYWCADKQVLTKQRGVFRVNCMDCLDRTNVVQSTIARFVLNTQLVRLGAHIAPEKGLAAYQGLEATLNGLWANNGDYISRQYAGTSAMKGDFTRTGKRNFGGLVSDASYSLARLWISTFRDYFSQSVLDFAMGHQSVSDVFRTIVELRSREPDYALQLAQTREAAVEASVAIVVHDGECVQLACVVHTPMTSDTLKLYGTIDSVIILTDAAVYMCRYDYQLEKVHEFQRIGLAGISRVQHGMYITDILAPHSLDATLNHGVVLYYDPVAAKLNASTSQGPQPGNAADAESLQAGSVPVDDSGEPPTCDAAVSRLSAERRRSASPMTTLSMPGGTTSASRPVEAFLACKLASEVQVVMQSMPRQPTVPNATPPLATSPEAGMSLTRLKALENQTPDLLAECLCSTIQSLKSLAGPVDARQFIVDNPIVGVAAAKQGTSLVHKMSNRLYKALWV